MQYNFSVYFTDDEGNPISDAIVKVSAFDEETFLWYDFSTNTFSETPVTKESLAVYKGEGIYACEFDFDSIQRRIHFTALCKKDTITRLVERVETFRFGILSPSQPVPIPEIGYVTIEDVRTFGLTEDILESDLEVARLITHASLQIDNYCGQWFNLRDKSLRVKYNGGRYIFLPTMLMSLSSITNIFSGEEIDTESVILFNSIPDDYDDPRIYLPYSIPISTDGVDLLIDGIWGVVADELGTILEPIRRACLITIADLLGYNTIEYEDTSLRQFIVMETTDRHQYTLSSEKMKAIYSNPTILPMPARMLLDPYIAPRVL